MGKDDLFSAIVKRIRQRDAYQKERKAKLSIGDKVILMNYPYYIATVEADWLRDRLVVNIPPDQREKEAKIQLQLVFGYNILEGDYKVLGKQMEKSIRRKYRKSPMVRERNPKQFGN